VESAGSDEQSKLPWIAIGISTIALAFSLLSYFDKGKTAVASAPTPAPAPVAATSSASASETGQPPDLSTMTPREAADRLFNRVMSANESGNSAEVTQFTPMALQAYANLGTLDDDALYHVGLIDMTGGDVKATREQIDLLRKDDPKHLLAYMLEYQIAEHDKNKDAAAQTYKAFLSAYEAEIATGRPEYQDHMKNIESFQKAAKAGAAAKK
jgi:hypothetical protein